MHPTSLIGIQILRDKKNTVNFLSITFFASALAEVFALWRSICQLNYTEPTRQIFHETCWRDVAKGRRSVSPSPSFHRRHNLHPIYFLSACLKYSSRRGGAFQTTWPFLNRAGDDSLKEKYDFVWIYLTFWSQLRSAYGSVCFTVERSHQLLYVVPLIKSGASPSCFSVRSSAPR